MENSIKIANEIFLIAKEKKIILAIAESCTGGLLCAAITAIPGSSRVFDRGFITYSNEAKVELLGVNKQTIKTYGSVSEETVREMAAGAIQNSKANVAISVSGVAGPGSDSANKAEGLVWVGVKAFKQSTAHKLCLGPIGRENVRIETVHLAYKILLKILKAQSI